MNSVQMLLKLRQDLKTVSSPKKAKASAWFFKTGPGQYGEGDVFVGATVPEQRAISIKYKDLPLFEIQNLLRSKIHEERLIGLFILILRYKSFKSDSKKKEIFDFYLKNKVGINNWDLVDSSAPYIVGEYLLERDKSVLYKMAESENLWDRRIAIISTLYFIKQNSFDDTLKLCEILNGDKHDLIQKACGWALREVGKKDIKILEKYLDKFHKVMPRTTLRYAIERMSQEKRYYYMGKVVK